MEKNPNSKVHLPGTTLDWIRSERKILQNVSNQWKALVLAFPVIGDFLAWKVGIGTQVRVGVDAIMGCDKRVFLSEALIHHLHLIGKATLNIVNKPRATTLWVQGWLSVEEINVVGDMVVEWKNYIFTLHRAHVRLTQAKDELIWGGNVMGGVYMTKLGYEALIGLGLGEEVGGGKSCGK
jgi:hypothetical protein